jgi:drug/metabolite transporter (DMT)-like permease
VTLLEKITTRNDERSARLAGIGLMLAGVCFFSLGDALGKFMVKTYSVGELLLLRAAVSLILVIPLVWRSRRAFLGISRPAMQLLRVALSIAEIAAFFAATVYLPLADIVTFYLAAPIFVTALSAILLGEDVDVRRWAAVGIGFCGILIALRPSAGVFDWPAAIALGGSIGFAFLMVVTRSLRGTPDIAMCQPLAQARASQRGGALSVFHDHLGGDVRLPRVRRCAAGDDGAWRRHHYCCRDLHLPARAGARAGGNRGQSASLTR